MNVKCVLIISTLIHFYNALKPENYLLKYGYIKTLSRNKQKSREQVNEGIKKFQSLHKLEVTGVLDEKTKALLAKSRCGNPDPVERFKVKTRTMNTDDDYVLQGSKWTNYKLTYKMTHWSKKISKEYTLKTIKSAFNAWSAVTPLRFILVEDMKRLVHIEMLFATGIHCCHLAPPDATKFDGPGGVNAHTAYPQYGGDLHVDDDEPWTEKYNPSDPNYISLLYVLMHEIGHALGLSHTLEYDSIMYPIYKTVDNTTLYPVDIQAIRVLYGNQSIKLP